jgi:serine/threonine protein kinase/tetratricopeptide (TPR) repeat protein
MKDRILGERFSILSSFFESNNIFEAKDTETGEKVLVKIISMLPKEMKRWTKFENELRVIAHLNHPGIIKIREWGDCEGGKYIAFEHIDGVRLSEAKLSVSSSIRVLLRIAEVLKSMHSVELLHRELRPENIVLYDQTNLLVKFFDFGTSASEETRLRQIKPNDIIRTLSWISPEALRNEPITLSSNLYQFGLISYMLLTGILPYREDTPSSLIWKIQHMNPLPVSSLNPRVPIPLDNALKRLLRKDPETRFGSIDEIIDILKDLAKQENISSTFSIRTGLLLGRGRMVGRTKELTKLTLSLKEQDRCEIFQITGELGIGRTRLLQEIESQARTIDTPTILIGCDEHHSNLNLSLINQIVLDCVNHIGVGNVGKSVFKNILTKLSPDLSSRIITADQSEIDYYELERQAIPALKWLLESVSRESRLVIIIDDAELMDKQSMRILHKLIPAIGDVPITIIMATGHGFRMEKATVIELEPLTRKDISIMLHESINFMPNMEDLSDQVFNISKGNPLILELIISGIATNKSIDAAGKPFFLLEDIPKKLEDLLKWQLPKLSQSVLDVLSIASVMGKSFDETSLEKIAGKSRHEIADSLDMGLLANIITHYKSPSGYRYRFISEGMSSILAKRLTERQQTSIHESVIRQLVHAGSDDNQIWDLIDHLKHTSNARLLIEQLIKASNIVVRNNDVNSAIEIAKEAYSISIKTADAAQETRAVINLCQILYLTGELDKALALLEGITKTAKKIGIDQLSESDLLFNMAVIHAWQGNMQKSQEYSQESFKTISRIGDDERMIELHSLESYKYGETDPELALRQAQKAVSLIEKYPDNELARQTYTNLSIAHLYNGNIDNARQAIQKSKEYSKQKTNLLFFYRTYIAEAQIALLEGNTQLATEIIGNLENESIIDSSPPLKIGLNLVKSDLLCMQAKFQEAIDILQETVSLNLQINSKIYAVKTLLKLGRIFLGSGNQDGAKYCLFQAESIAADIDQSMIATELAIVKAGIHFQDEEEEKCNQILGQLQYQKINPFEKISYRLLMSRCLARKGDLKKSLQMLTEDGMIGKQVSGLPSVSYAFNMAKAELLMSIITKTSEMTLPQKTLFLSKNSLLGQDLPATIKQSLDLAYVNTLYSGDSTQQPLASFTLAKFHCLMSVIDSQNSQYHKDECTRLLEMTNALANDLNMSTLIIRTQNLDLALKSGKMPTGI